MMTKPSYKRSGGPNTPKGKLAVSKNALKAGVYSTALLLPGESEADFQELYESLLVELQAEGVLESTLIRDLAVTTWKRLRVEQIEHRLIVNKLELPASPEELFQAGLPQSPELEMALVSLEDLKEDNRQQFLAKKQLAENLMNRSTRSQAIDIIKSDFQPTYLKLITWSSDRRDQFLLQGVEMVRLMHAEKSAAATGDFSEVLEVLGAKLGLRMLEEANALLYALDRLDQIRSAEQRVKDQRLTNMLLAEGPNRAKDDLNRNFYRTLKELRTQQAWRKQNQIIDVTPSTTTK